MTDRTYEENNDFEQTDIFKVYEIIRRQIEHEDDLVVRRLNWLLVSQGFFFVAYAEVLTWQTNSVKLIPLVLIGFFSLSVAIFTLMGLLAAFNSLKNINEIKGIGINIADSSHGQRVLLGRISLRWVGAWYASGKTSASGIAISLIVAWSLILAWTIWQV